MGADARDDAAPERQRVRPRRDRARQLGPDLRLHRLAAPQGPGGVAAARHRPAGAVGQGRGQGRRRRRCDRDALDDARRTWKR